MSCSMSRKCLIILLSALIAIVLLAAFFCILFFKSKKPRNGEIIASQKECAKIGEEILGKKGTFVDAAIAMLFCEGVYRPQNMGLGGGFLATIYIKSKANVESLIAKERIPKALNESISRSMSLEGSLSIAVPGELKGYYELHQKYGKLEWAALVQPSIKICEAGYLVNSNLARDLKRKEGEILKWPSFREVFVNRKTNSVFERGNRIDCMQLTRTLKVIAKYGAKAMYGGIIGKWLVQDIQEHGGIITEEDLQLYEHQWRAPIKTMFNNHTVYTVPSPGSGLILATILEILKAIPKRGKLFQFGRYGVKLQNANSSIDVKFDIETLSNILRELSVQLNATMMYGFQQTQVLDRISKNIMKYFNRHGKNKSLGQIGENVVVLTPNGNVIVVTSTINSIFGAMRRSARTGIILNDNLRNFFNPNAFGIEFSDELYTNAKYPFSFMCPAIVIDPNGFPRLILSAGSNRDMLKSALKLILKDFKKKPKKRMFSMYQLRF